MSYEGISPSKSLFIIYSVKGSEAIKCPCACSEKIRANTYELRKDVRNEFAVVWFVWIYLHRETKASGYRRQMSALWMLVLWSSIVTLSSGSAVALSHGSSRIWIILLVVLVNNVFWRWWLHGTIAAPSLSSALSAPAAVTKHTGYDVICNIHLW